MEVTRKPLAKIEGRKRMQVSGLTVAWHGTRSLKDWVAYVEDGDEHGHQECQREENRGEQPEAGDIPVGDIRRVGPLDGLGRFVGGGRPIDPLHGSVNLRNEHGANRSSSASASGCRRVRRLRAARIGRR